MMRAIVTSWILIAIVVADVGAADATDVRRDILVTFDNSGARASSTGAPYRFRKRYEITSQVRSASAAVAREHDLVRVDHWPIRSLSVYCFVYRVPEGVDRDVVVALLNADERVESAQLLQQFETQTLEASNYNDPYATMQYGLEILDITAAHRQTQGAGIRIAIIDSHADVDHEDLKGQIHRIEVFSSADEAVDVNHGTAVASVIGARSNNALGIVGVAPQATLDVFVSCWHAELGDAVVCDSFTLSKALDRVLDDPPQVLNLSLTGPQDMLVMRLLERAMEAGVIVVAASPAVSEPNNEFPSGMSGVIGVGRSVRTEGRTDSTESTADQIFAPGDQIMVAIPNNQYDFRSGSSLAAAHVSGVVALLLSVAPNESAPLVRDILLQSQIRQSQNYSVNACGALELANPDFACDL